MKKCILTLVLFFLFINVFAQKQYNKSLYNKKPIWIEMMDDEFVNYFEIQKAYSEYWEKHQKPEGESDMDVKQVEKNKKRFSKKEIREARDDAKMRMQIKKYNWWLQKMEPFVKDDGSIMTPEERIQANH